jgi:hypothetical protein
MQRASVEIHASQTFLEGSLPCRKAPNLTCDLGGRIKLIMEVPFPFAVSKALINCGSKWAV